MLCALGSIEVEVEEAINMTIAGNRAVTWPSVFATRDVSFAATFQVALLTTHRKS